MSQSALPDGSAFLPDARAALARIEKRCPVAVEHVTLEGESYPLLMVQDISALISGDPFADPSQFPTWTKLWEASILLACYVKQHSFPAGTRILELGAGLGLPSVVAAQKGLQVTASDHDPLVCDFLRVNAQLNNVEYTVVSLDWLAPPALLSYDVIIAAEVVFREELFAPLLELCREVLAPEGCIYLAHDASRRSLAPFLAKAADDFIVSAMKQTIRKDQATALTVILNRLRKKAP